jgi:histidyl-tRNA synthetase
VAYMGEAAGDTAFKITADLRRGGVSAIVATGSKSLKAQLRQANTLGAVYAVIIGEDEVKAGTVTLRHMADAVQQTLKMEELTAKLKG